MGPKVIKYVVFVVIVVNLIIVAIVFSGGNTPSREPMPNPNGADDFVKAGQMVRSITSLYSNYTKEVLTTLVATNAEPLTLLHIGLSRECRDPIYSPDYSSTRMQELASFKVLAYLLVAEGHLAELNGHPEQATQVYVDGIRFGQELSRGGLIVDKLVGIADEHIASRPLSDLLPSITNSAKCREIAGALETIDAREEPIATTLEQEKRWVRETYGFRGQILQLLEYKSQKAIKDRFVTKVQSTQATRRRMMIDFAARAYELDKGKTPQTVTELVPDYLKAVPKDPVTGRDMGLGR